MKLKTQKMITTAEEPETQEDGEHTTDHCERTESPGKQRGVPSAMNSPVVMMCKVDVRLGPSGCIRE